MRLPHNKRLLSALPPSCNASARVERLHGRRAPTAVTRRKSNTSAFMRWTTSFGTFSRWNSAAHSDKTTVVPLVVFTDMNDATPSMAWQNFSHYKWRTVRASARGQAVEHEHRNWRAKKMPDTGFGPNSLITLASEG